MHNVIIFFRRWRQPRMFIPLYGVFLASGALITFLSLFNSLSKPEKAFIFGYSLGRVLLGAGLLVLFFTFATLTLKSITRPEWSIYLWNIVFENNIANKVISWIAASFFLFSWIVLFLPSYRLTDSLFQYIVQLYSVIVWILFVSAVTVLILLLHRKRESIVSVIFTNKTIPWVGVITFVVLILVGAAIVFTGVGVRQREDYWYGAGVPVLGVQIFFSLIIGMFFAWMESRWDIKKFRKLDLLIGVAIWIIAAWLWAREPLQPNYFLPDTAKNNIYPYSDSATFDIGSQFALIGQGMFNGKYFDRALYSAFLTYLHLLVGQKTEYLMTAQAIIYAVFPVIIYFLGKDLHSRALGISAASLILLRGINSIIVASWVDLSSPKMMLTDFPTAIGIALIMLFILKWLKQPSNGHFAIWAGGMIGMTLMLRTHVLILAPFLIVYMLVSVLPRWKYWAMGSLFLILGMLAATSPWDIRNLPNGTPMFYVYYSRIEEVLRARYQIKEGTYSPPSISDFATISNFQQSRAQTFNRESVRERMAIGPLNTNPCDSRICLIVNNFFHNLVTSVVFLPASFKFDDLWNVVKNGTPYWEQDWVGNGVGLPEGIFIVVNLALISLGIGAACAHNKFTGFLPVALFLIYILSNALALTSGGRYIAPIDWVVCVYYILGVLQVASWGLRVMGIVFLAEAPQVKSVTDIGPAPQYFKTVTTLALVLMIGFLIPASEMPFESRYQKHTSKEMLVMLEQQGWLERANLTRPDLSKFLSTPGAKLIEGRMLYPRYYDSGDGESKRVYPFMKLDYPRLAFLTIGPYGSGLENVIMRGGKPKRILNASDVIVIGCKNKSFFDALVVFVLTERGSVYLRSPWPKLQCPLPSS